MSESIKTLPLVFEEPRGRGKPPRHLADLTPPERKARLEELGLPGFRAKQLSAHYFSRLVDDPEQMTDLPAAQRAELVEGLLPHLMTPLRTLEADKGTTRKTLWKLFDGALVESVLMRYPGRVTMCVSSQAGCGMACPFCATGQGGLQRNMSTGEIVEQVVAGARSLARDEVPGGPGRVSNVVFMGMGEPMANYKAVIGAVRRLTDPDSRRARHVRARHHRQHRRPGPADQPAHRGGHPGDAGAQPARARRRAPQRAGPGEHPLEGRRGRRGGVELRPRHEAPGVDRVRHDARHQRPGLAGRPARRRAQLLRRLGLGARQPDPAQPDARARSGPPATRPTSASSSAGSRPRASRPRSATPAAARSTAPAASWPRSTTETRTARTPS